MSILWNYQKCSKYGQRSRHFHFDHIFHCTWVTCKNAMFLNSILDAWKWNFSSFFLHIFNVWLTINTFRRWNFCITKEKEVLRLKISFISNARWFQNAKFYKWNSVCWYLVMHSKCFYKINAILIITRAEKAL